MTQLGIGVAALNHDSSFQTAYEKGIKKGEYWSHTLDDCIQLIARLPALAARIYRNVYRPGSPLAPIDKELDLVGNHHRFSISLIGSSLALSNRQLLEHARLWR